MVDKPSIRVAAALIEEGGKYLVARRKEGTHLGGLWEFPGGKCEEGETYESCVSREVLEELGIEITLPRFFLTHCHEYPEKLLNCISTPVRFIKANPGLWDVRNSTGYSLRNFPTMSFLLLICLY